MNAKLCVNFGTSEYFSRPYPGLTGSVNGVPSPSLLSLYEMGGFPGFTYPMSTERGKAGSSKPWEPPFNFLVGSGIQYPTRGGNNPGGSNIFPTKYPISLSYFGQKRRKKVKKKRIRRRKVHFGSRGGRYVIKNGRKKYL